MILNDALYCECELPLEDGMSLNFVTIWMPCNSERNQLILFIPEFEVRLFVLHCDCCF